jgi:hypothetical protein
MATLPTRSLLATKYSAVGRTRQMTDQPRDQPPVMTPDRQLLFKR